MKFERQLLKGVAPALVCALMAAAPAAAAQYFWDNFEDGDMSNPNWTNLTWQVQAFDSVSYGLHGYASRGYDMFQRINPRAIADFDSTHLADTIHVSFDFMHAGGHLAGGHTGPKITRVWLVDDAGAGYGVEVSMNKDTLAGIVTMMTTDDNGATIGGHGNVLGGNVDWLAENDFKERRVEVVWDRANASMEVYLEGTLIHYVDLDSAQNEDLKDPTKVISNPGQTWFAVPKYMSMDNIWVGDQSNPSAPDPILVQGDANGDLKVDIIDLTALAANWSALTPGPNPKDWTQGNFNYGLGHSCGTWVVDIVDLTALAANWSFVGSAPPVPEPATIALFGLAGLSLIRRRR